MPLSTTSDYTSHRAGVEDPATAPAPPEPPLQAPAVPPLQDGLPAPPAATFRTPVSGDYLPPSAHQTQPIVCTSVPTQSPTDVPAAEPETEPLPWKVRKKLLYPHIPDDEWDLPDFDDESPGGQPDTDTPTGTVPVHETQPLQVIDKFRGEHAFLSNFAKCDPPVVYDNDTYPTSEHVYQAAKLEQRALRRPCMCGGALGDDPRIAKRRGARGKLRPDWETLKVSITIEIVRAKFPGSPHFREQLLATGSRPLIGHTNDTFWSGQRNHLGKILMLVRDELRAQSGPTATPPASTKSATPPFTTKFEDLPSLSPPPRIKPDPTHHPARPVTLELCCGHASVSAKLHNLGFEGIGVDHSYNRNQPLLPILDVDLTTEPGQRFILALLRNNEVALRHLQSSQGTTYPEPFPACRLEGPTAPTGQPPPCRLPLAHRQRPS